MSTIATLLIASRTLTKAGAGEFFVAISIFAIAQGLHDARLYDAEQAPLLARRSLDRLLASYGAPAVSTPA